MLSALQNPRQAASQIIGFGLILSTAFMMWKGLSVIADSPSPIVVVLSGSMEPAFQRGDLLFLWNRNLIEETKVGEVVVYNVKGKDIPIVHRVVRKFGTGYVMLFSFKPLVIRLKHANLCL
jgi:signal peptidase